MYTSFEDFFPVIALDSTNIKLLDKSCYQKFNTRIKKYAELKLTAPFRAQIVGPCIDKDKHLHYAIGKSIATFPKGEYASSAKKTQSINPQKNTRLGTLREYDLFCAWLIQRFIQKGLSLEEAYEIVFKPIKMRNQKSGYYLLKNQIWSDHLVFPVFVYETHRKEAFLTIHGARFLTPSSNIYSTPFVVSDL